MSFLLKLAVGITSTTTILGGYALGTFANLDSQEIADLAKESTVLVNSKMRELGVIYKKEDDNYFVVTAKHILLTSSSYKLGIPINLVKKPIKAISRIYSPELPEEICFAAPPRLENYASILDIRRATETQVATSYFTISLPPKAEFPLAEIQLQQTNESDFLQYYIEQTKGFEGTRENLGSRLFISLVEETSETRTITVRIDPPLLPGKTLTLKMNPFVAPLPSDIYQLKISAFPPGENACRFPLGLVKLDFKNLE